MSKISKPNHYPQLMPYLTVKDADNAMQFYTKAFGFVEHEPPMREEGKIVHAALRRDDCVIMISPEGAFDSKKISPKSGKFLPPIGLYIYINNVDEFFEQAVNAGAEGISNPTDMFWGDRMCILKDLDGYEWTFATFKQTD